MSIYQLPDELILEILSYLEIKDFLSCGQGGVHVLWILEFWDRSRVLAKLEKTTFFKKLFNF